MADFPSRLRHIRNAGHKTQREVADALGVQARSYQAYEGGAREPNIAKLIALADLFDVSLDYLMGRADENT